MELFVDFIILILSNLSINVSVVIKLSYKKQL